jgi:WD40 repeat protein
LSVELWDVNAGRALSESARHTSPIHTIAWAGAANTYASAEDGQILVWSSGTVESTLDVPAGGIQQVIISADGRRVLGAGLDGGLYEWDLNQAVGTADQVRQPGPFPAEPGCTDIGPASIEPVAGGFVVVCTKIARLDAATGLPHEPLADLKSRALTSFATNHNGRYVAVTLDSSLQVHDTSTAARTLPVPVGLGQPPDRLAIDDNGQVVAAATDTEVTVVNPATGALIMPARTIPNGVWSIALSPDGRSLAIGQLNGTVMVWHPGSDQHPITIRLGPATSKVRDLTFSADGQLLAAGSSSGRPAVVATDTWRPVWLAAVGHAGITTSLAFSPDGQTLVSAGSDARQLVYDLATGNLLATLTNGDPQWTFATFLPDGRHLAVAEYDGSIRVHALDPATWIARACAIANRDMTAAEWNRLLPGRTRVTVCPPRQPI